MTTDSEKFIIDNPEEEGYPHSQASIRNLKLIKELRKELEDLKKEIHG